MSDQSFKAGLRDARTATVPLTCPVIRLQTRPRERDIRSGGGAVLLAHARLGGWFWVWILVAVSSWSGPGRADPPGQLEGSATQDTQIEFVTPTDWGCTKRGTCIECRNVTDHPTSIRIGALNESTRRTQSMPAGAQLEICSSGNTPS